MVKLLELALVRRIRSFVEDRISCSQYAYQRARRTEVLLSDLDRVVTGNARAEKVTYVVGLDVAGAFDSASPPELVEATGNYGIPAPVYRFIGAWLTGRTVSIKLRSPIGAVYGGNDIPTRGVPQGGVLSPLLWLLYVNTIVDGTLRQLHREAGLPPQSWGVIIQIFADDISAAIGREHRQPSIELAHLLIAALLRHLGKTDLDVSLPECQNFLVEGAPEETREGPKETVRNLNRRLREQNRQRMSQDLGTLEKSREEEDKKELPFPWTYSFKLLGIILDCR